jgi:cellulose synthase/poly-beta-1,6-N-acetylglucosamine synthase-like glycosyltransferase
VVVPTYKRSDLLDRCLTALVKQDFDPRNYEIIIADDAASSETHCQVVQWANAHRCRGIDIRYVTPCRGKGPAAARNAGWRAARGTIVAFTDDDCIPQQCWLRNGVSAFGPCDVALAGRVVVPPIERPTDYEKNASLLANADFVTASCFFRREILEQLGGFDPRFEAAWREDSDLIFRLVERGYRIGNASDAVVVHPVRPASWGVSLRQQRKSCYNALLYRKHPALYRERIQASPPWHYYRTVGALLAATVATLTGRRRVAGGATLLWVILSGRFCLARLRGTSHSPKHIAEMIVTSALIPPLAIFWRIRGAIRFRVPFL